MSVWVLHEKLTPDEEQHIHERTHLSLPFEGLPDLSQVHNLAQCQHLLRALHPKDAIETLALKADRIWSQYSGLQLEDLVAVPLPASKKVALCRISGSYTYRVDINSLDVHLLPVTWYPGVYSFKSFGRQDYVFHPTGNRLYAITNPQAARAIREKLPHSYNRFRHFKWVWAIIFALGLVRLFARLDR
jgi:hypothetical protein